MTVRSTANSRWARQATFNIGVKHTGRTQNRAYNFWFCIARRARSRDYEARERRGSPGASENQSIIIYGDSFG